MKRGSRSFIIVSLYVDNLLIATNSRKAVKKTEVKLSSRFDLANCGEIEICFGLETHHARAMSKLKLSKRKCMFKVQGRFSMLEAKPCQTSREEQISNVSLSKKIFPSTAYRQAIGTLQYFLIYARPDDAFSVSRLHQFMENAASSVWTCVKRVLKYLNGKREFQFTSDMENCVPDKVIGTATRNGQTGRKKPRWDTYSKFPEKKCLENQRSKQLWRPQRLK